MKKDKIMDDRITIIGAGGIGCAVGYSLRQAGVAVTFIDKNAHKVEAGKQTGVAIVGLPPLSAEFVHFDEWRPTPESSFLLCTKCYDNAEVLAKLPKDSMVVPIQNGFDQQLSDIVFEGIASFVSECHPDRPITRITRSGKLHVGCRLGDATPKHSRVIDLLTRSSARVAGITPVLVPRILPFKYTKLMYNAAISPIAAAAGLDNGELLSIRKARGLFFDQLRENHKILSEAGVALDTIGPFHPNTVARILSQPWLARAMAWAFYPSLRGSYCSMSGDLPRGQTEVEYYNRHLIDIAGDRPCPLNRRVYSLIKRMEAERLAPSLDRLDEL